MPLVIPERPEPLSEQAIRWVCDGDKHLRRSFRKDVLIVVTPQIGYEYSFPIWGEWE